MKSGHVRTDNECCRPLNDLAATLDVSLGERRDDTSAMAIADPQLASIENPPRAVCAQASGRLDVLCIGACLWFSESIGGERLATREHRQVSCFLIDVAEEHDGFGP